MAYSDPRYFGDRGDVIAKLRRAGEEPDLTIGSSMMVRYRATVASTNAAPSHTSTGPCQSPSSLALWLVLPHCLPCILPVSSVWSEESYMRG